MALVLSLVDRMSGPTRQADKTLDGMGKTAGLVSGKFGKLGKDMDLLVGRMEKVKTAGRNIAITGLAAGGLLGLGSVPGDAAKAEHALRAMGNVGEMSDKQLAGMNSSLLNTTTTVNQMQLELIAGMNTLVAAGLNPEIATRFMPTIGKAATATQSAVDDLAKTTYAVYDNLKVPESKLLQSIDTLTLSGKRGQFELKNMARYFPMLTAGAQSLKMQGIPAVASLGAALQVAMKGAGSPEEAATNFQNFLQKITSKDTVKNFKKMGVDVEKEMQMATAKGLDPIEHMMNVITRLTGGNKFKLAEIFGDMQVTNFIVPMMKNMELYRQIRNETMTASGVVDKDYKAMMGTTIEQWKLLKVTMAKIVMPNLAGPMSLVNGLLKVMTSNSLLTKLAFYGIAATITGGGLLFGIGTLGAMLPKILIGAKLAATGLGILRTAAWLLWQGLTWNPVTLPLVAAIAGVGAAIYQLKKHWQVLKQPGFFRDLWGWARQSGANVVNSLWQGMKSVAMKPVELIKGIAQKIRNHLPFSPAKEGPLRDIHRIRLVETIADSLKPAPLVRAMRTIALAASVTAAPVGAMAMTPAAGGGQTITFSPQITIQGNADRAQIEQAVSMSFQEFERLMQRYESQRQRRSF